MAIRSGAAVSRFHRQQTGFRMDLPTCPACGQSVLDDDAQDCPFCGSSMKGGAPSKGAIQRMPVKPPPAKQAAPPPPVPAGERPLPAINKPPKPAPAKTEEEDPFAVDQSAAGKAIAVSASPGKGRSLEVVCPMCETHGFISLKAAGQLVKCCNPECLVPTFTAPAVEKKPAAVAPPPAPKSSTGMVLWGSIAAVLVVGAGVYWFVGGFGGGEKNPTLGIDPGQGYQFKNTGGEPEPDPVPKAAAAKDKKDKKDTEETPDKAVAVQATTAKSAAEMTKAAFEALVDASRKASPNRKAFCRRLAAIEFAQAGDIPAALEQIEQLKKVAGRSQHEAVLPLVAVAWQQLAQPAELAKTLAQAEAAAKQLPPRGRHSLDATVALCSVLAAANRVEDAQRLLAAHHASPNPANDTLTAAIAIVRADGSFNLDAPLLGRTLDEWQAPLEVAVTLTLAGRGRWNEGLAWAKQAPGSSTAAECTLAWAEALAMHSLDTKAENAADEMARATAAAADLFPAANAWFLGRVAALQVAKNNRAAAEEWLKKAQAALGTAPPPSPLRIGGIKELMELKLPDAAPLRMAALARAEIGGVRSRLGQTDGAWSDYSTSVAFLRGMAPSPSIVGKMQRDVKTNSPEVMRQQLIEALDLKNDDEARRNMNLYKQKLGELYKAAMTRFHLEISLLTAAVNLGLLDQVGQEIQSASVKTDLNEREPFGETPLATLVLARFEAVGKKDEREALSGVLQVRSDGADPLPALREQSAALIDAGKVDDAADRLQNAGDVKEALDEWMLRLASRLVKAGKSDAALRFLANVQDESLREEGLRLAAALAARDGQAGSFTTAVAARTPLPPETAALNAGLIEGLLRLSQAPPAAAPAPPPSEKAAPK